MDINKAFLFDPVSYSFQVFPRQQASLPLQANIIVQTTSTPSFSRLQNISD